MRRATERERDEYVHNYICIYIYIIVIYTYVTCTFYRIMRVFAFFLLDWNIDRYIDRSNRIVRKKNVHELHAELPKGIPLFLTDVKSVINMNHVYNGWEEIKALRWIFPNMNRKTT